MYAVLVDNTVVYLGSNTSTVDEILKLKGPTASAIVVNDLEELEQAITVRKSYINEEVVDGLSRAATRLFKILEDSGLNNTDELKGKQAVAQVRSLGIKEMRTVGDGFIAFGDLLRKTAENQE